MNKPWIFDDQTQWIVQNRERLNIRFVFQTGDLVQNGALRRAEWKAASEALAKLDAGRIPYGILPGNHDIDRVNSPVADAKQYDATFPVSRFDRDSWFGGSYIGYRNSYQLLSAGGTKYLMVDLEVDPTDDVLAWAGSVLAKYPRRKVILVTHAYLDDRTGGRFASPYFRPNGNSGEGIWKKLVNGHCNVFLVLSGHSHSGDGENRLRSMNACGKPVEQVTQDYQARKNGGNGLLRVLTVYPAKKLIRVSTYSPYTNTYERDSDSEFDVPLPS